MKKRRTKYEEEDSRQKQNYFFFLEKKYSKDVLVFLISGKCIVFSLACLYNVFFYFSSDELSPYFGRVLENGLDMELKAALSSSPNKELSKSKQNW